MKQSDILFNNMQLKIFSCTNTLRYVLKQRHKIFSCTNSLRYVLKQRHKGPGGSICDEDWGPKLPFPLPSPFTALFPSFPPLSLEFGAKKEKFQCENFNEIFKPRNFTYLISTDVLCVSDNDDDDIMLRCSNADCSLGTWFHPTCLNVTQLPTVAP